jgi:hypothetical protein
MHGTCRVSRPHSLCMLWQSCGMRQAEPGRLSSAYSYKLTALRLTQVNSQKMTGSSRAARKCTPA